jgi:DNA helicase II / ATP-dependent DNA helicase PcrA
MPDNETREYPAVITNFAHSKTEEVERLAQFIKFLKSNHTISSFSDVTLLLRSVRTESSHYCDGLTKYEIPYYLSNTGSFFGSTAIKLMLGCYAVIFGYYKIRTWELGEYATDSHLSYLGQCIEILYSSSTRYRKLMRYVHDCATEISSLGRREYLNINYIDYFYEILGFAPFSHFMNDGSESRNLSKFSQLLKLFQRTYHAYNVKQSQSNVQEKFFLDFLGFLIESRFAEKQDNDAFVNGYVRIMTIHQSKGLDFPVVIVGSLDSYPSTKSNRWRFR